MQGCKLMHSWRKGGPVLTRMGKSHKLRRVMMLASRGKLRGILVLALALSLGACATKPPESDPVARAEYERINDPLEPLNRATHEFNMTMDRYLLKPIAEVYRFIIPAPIRTLVTNFLDNLQSPV